MILQGFRVIRALLMAAAMQISIHGHVLTGNEVVKPDAWPTAAELENMDVEYLEQLVLARLDEMSVRSEKGYGAKHDEAEKRKLEPSSQYNIFLPQTCNSGLNTADCTTTLSSLLNVNPGTEIVVECGSCVTVDYTNGEVVTLPLGINVIGKLHFPSTANLVLRTQYLFVQGELVIDPPSEMNKVKVLLFGTTNQTIIPHGENVALCESTGCAMGRKPIAVVGGRVDIRGLVDSSCPSWVKLKQVSNPESGSSQPCNELTQANRDAEMGVTQPFSSAAIDFQVLAEDAGNSYFAVRGRNTFWDGISGDLALECYNASISYRVSFRYRLDAAVADHATIRFTYKSFATGEQVKTPYFECPKAADSASGWVDCSFDVRPSINVNDAANLSFDLWMKGDQTSNLDFDNISITPGGGYSILHVDEKAASCWKPGDEILLTSWLKNPDMRLTATISQVGTGTLTLEEKIPITALATEAEDPVFAVEVASLSRRVIFEAELDDPTREYKLGGHFMIYHTPEQIQLLQGVKLVNFGQQGELGRYPIHFHLSGSVAGSEVSKNVIYNSNQRCVVVHGSHNLDINDNVAFETHGHCFITEDGIETGNTFTRNLGASIRRPVYVIEGENDNSPSIFWITNPQNRFVDNVAAGSEFSGFWFDTRPDVRGPSKSGNEGVHPQTLPLGTFANNTAHSSGVFGIQYYSPGYRPLVEARMDGNNVYRNNVAGHFVHTCSNIRIVGGIAAYNHINIKTFRNADIVMDSIKIIGYPDVDLAIEKEFNVPECTGNQFGVSIHSWRLEVSDNSTLGFTAVDLDFSGMGSDIGCSKLSAVWVDPVQTEKAVSDTVNRFSGTTFHDDIERVNFCDAISIGVTNLLVEDVDGSFASTGLPGFFVGDEGATHFVNGNGCSSIPQSCAYRCESACLRQVGFEVSNAIETGKIEMVVSQNGVSALAVWDQFSYEDTQMQNYFLGFNGRYGIPLPAGDFSVSFVDIETGTLTWPSYVRTVFEEPPLCSSFLTSVTLVRPEATKERCGDAIKGGTFEDSSYDHWQLSQGMAMEIVSPGSQSSGYALQFQNDGSNSMIIGQWIDTTCLISGVDYVFGADIRLVADSGAILSCDPAVSNNCPLAHFQLQDYNVETKETVVYYFTSIGVVSSPADVNGWYRMSGSFRLTVEEVAMANKALVRIILPRDLNFQIDNLSLVAPFDSTLIPNGPSGMPVSLPAATATVAPSSLRARVPNAQSGMPSSPYSISPSPIAAPSPSKPSGMLPTLYTRPTATSAPSHRDNIFQNSHSGMPASMYTNSPAPMGAASGAPASIVLPNSLESSPVSAAPSPRTKVCLPLLSSMFAMGIAVMMH